MVAFATFSCWMILDVSIHNLPFALRLVMMDPCLITSDDSF
jgi:hypothetical protein